MFFVCRFGGGRFLFGIYMVRPRSRWMFQCLPSTNDLQAISILSLLIVVRVFSRVRFWQCSRFCTPSTLASGFAFALTWYIVVIDNLVGSAWILFAVCLMHSIQSNRRAGSWWVLKGTDRFRRACSLFVLWTIGFCRTSEYGQSE
jgi:hypothetical protein